MSQTTPNVALAALLAALLIVPAAAAVQVKTRHTPGTDFSALSSYSWRSDPQLGPNHPLAEGTPLDRQIRAAADEILSRAGFERVAKGAALEVSYVGYVTEILNIEGQRTELGEGVAWIGDPQAHSTMTYEEGTLVFEIRDASSGDLLWTGWATDVARTPDKLRKKAVKGVRKILHHFPPER